MNGIFGIDIILNFFTAYNSTDYAIIDDIKVKFTNFNIVLVNRIKVHANVVSD